MKNALQLIALIATLAISTTAHAHWELLNNPVELVRADGSKASGQISAARCGTIAHLDDDGVLDLVTGHALGQGGAVVAYRGDGEFRQGLRRDLWRAEEGLPPVPAFEERAVVFEIPIALDWLVVGDLDGDGTLDIAGAARGRDRLLVLGGDGEGGFAAPIELELPGAVTALAAGDVNRADTVTDLVIAIKVGGGGAVLVYEHPAGALHAEPEWHHLEAAATDVGVGRLDDDPWADIAVAADDLVVVFGRDRKLAERALKRQRVDPARAVRLAFETPAHDLAFGRFVTGDDPQLAVRRVDGVVELVQSIAGRLEHTALVGLASPAAASFDLVAVRTAGGGTDDIVVLDAGVLAATVVPPSETGSGSLEKRVAVNASAHTVIAAQLNRDARDDLVLLGDDVAPQIVKTTPRAVFTVNSTADTDDGLCNTANCTLREALNAANAAPTVSGIVMDLSSNAVIAPTDWLPLIQVSDLTIDGTVGFPPFTTLLRLDGGSCFDCNGFEIFGDSTTVTSIAFGNFRKDGATSRAALNLNSDGNLVAGCLIGIDSLGSSTPNHIGVILSGGESNTIGGSTSADRNVISANDSSGVVLTGGAGHNNRVIGNYIGTNSSGTASIGNIGSGVLLLMAGQNFIGTALPGEGNVIAANAGYGIDVALAASSPSSNAYVLQNLVGVAADGVTQLINVEGGIHVENQRNTTIGGSGSGPRNVVSASSIHPAIEIEGDSAGTVVRGNYLGIGSDGATALPPADDGISVTSSEVTVGGTVSGYGNVIGPNNHYGIEIGSPSTAVSDCDVLGNTIGTDVAQQTPMVNGTAGISLWSCSSCAVGDPAEPDSGNTIVAVGTHQSTCGIKLSDCDDIQIAHNRIGETEAGLPMGNGTGIRVFDSLDCQIGWGNTVAHSLGRGITIQNASSGILVATNSIHSNDEIGIELGSDMVTPNDPGDTDTGPNNLQNYPVITGYDPGTGFVTATLDSDQAMTTYMVQLYEVSSCDIFGNGEGETYLGAVSVMSDGTGDSSITMGATPTPGWFLTMLASDPDGNTSEFSECFEAGASADLIFADGFEVGTTGGWDAVTP